MLNVKSAMLHRYLLGLRGGIAGPEHGHTACPTENQGCQAARVGNGRAADERPSRPIGGSVDQHARHGVPAHVVALQDLDRAGRICPRRRLNRRELRIDACASRR